MKKKIIYQSMISLLLIGIFIFFFKTYYKKQDITFIETKPKEESKEDFANITQNIEFTTISKKGHKYYLYAETGETDFDNPDVIFLTNVKATIQGSDDLLVVINSDFGKYNSKNHDTIFSKNVVVKETVNKINSDYLDLSLENNLATMSGNIIFKNLTTNMKADRVNFNLENKETIMFMNNDSEKITVSKNY